MIGSVGLITSRPRYSRLTCVARNLKFYPLALKRAADNESCLAHVATQFKVRLCTGKEKVLADCEAWDLLNLTSDEVISLTSRISETFGFSALALQEILNQYLIQTTGKDELEKYFGIQQPPRYLCPKTTHYSWPKGAGKSCIQAMADNYQSSVESRHWNWIKKHYRCSRRRPSTDGLSSSGYAPRRVRTVPPGCLRSCCDYGHYRAWLRRSAFQNPCTPPEVPDTRVIIHCTC